MDKQIILRPVFNRPEMLQISLEYEIAARKYYMTSDKFITMFLIEYGSPQKTLELVKNYPFEKEIIIRTEKFGLSKNILEGMKTAFDIADDFVIHLEDDVLIHETYFKFMKVFLDLIKTKVGKFSYLSAGGIPSSSIFKVSKCERYLSWAPLINKEFFIKYIKPCANSDYYDHRGQFVFDLSGRYKEKYKYNKAWTQSVTKKWNEQAGLIGRLIKVAGFEENMYAFGNSAARQRHIGYFGKNRPKGILPGNNFEERLKNLREIIKDISKMYKLSGAEYKDCYLFVSERLDSWDGKLILV